MVLYEIFTDAFQQSLVNSFIRREVQLKAEHAEVVAQIKAQYKVEMKAAGASVCPVRW